MSSMKLKSIYRMLKTELAIPMMLVYATVEDYITNTQEIHQKPWWSSTKVVIF